MSAPITPNDIEVILALTSPELNEDSTANEANRVIQFLVAALRMSAIALERSYDAVEWPADGTSKQEKTAKAIRAVVGEGDEQ